MMFQLSWHRARKAIEASQTGRAFRVYVYRNLHKNCLSVRYRGRVIAYTNEIKLRDVKFKVVQSGRNRVIREGKKNVHAYVSGIPVKWMPDLPKTRCLYDPYRFDSFVVAGDQSPIIRADYCHIKNFKIYAKPSN